VNVVHIVMKKWKLSFWWMGANLLRKMAKILPLSGSMIVLEKFTHAYLFQIALEII